MNRLFKIYLKNVIFAILLTACLVVLGANGVGSVSDIELLRSTYTRTEFDFHIAAPDAAQVAEIAKDDSVKTIFPYYAYAKAFGNTSKVTLLVSDEIDKLGASVLSEGTLIEGSFDKDGAMLDKTAADALGVGVGDTVSFNILGKRITKEVVAIYLPSTLTIMKDGVVAVDYSADIAAASKPAAYGGAFIVANDRSAVAALLSGYVGEGNVALTYEQYVTINCGDKMPNQSDAEYEAECQQKYATYRQQILDSAKKGGNQVVDKLEAYNLVKERILTTENSLKSLKLLTAIASFAAFAVVGILFTVTNKKNDIIYREDGQDGWKMLVGYSVSAAVTGFAVALITGIAVFLIASGTYFASECTSVLLSATLPVLAAIPVVVVAAFLYVKDLYKNVVEQAKQAKAEIGAQTELPVQEETMVKAANRRTAENIDVLKETRKAEKPVTEQATVTDEAPVAVTKQVTVTDEAPVAVAEQVTVADEVPVAVAKQVTVTDEVPSVEQTTVTDEAPVIEKAQTVDGTPADQKSEVSEK